jgi:hypothetical protein
MKKNSAGLKNDCVTPKAHLLMLISSLEEKCDKYISLLPHPHQTQIYYNDNDLDTLANINTSFTSTRRSNPN